MQDFSESILFLKDTETLSHFFLFPEQLSIPKSVNYNATLELSDVILELFRIKRYYNNFTHLKYDCVRGWPYEWVAHTILVIALVLAVTLFVNFTSRFLKSKQPEYSNI